MANLRKAIRLFPHEIQLLKQLYFEFRVPSDQYRRRPDELSRFVDSWNGLTGRSDAPGEILHYIITQRKQKKWVTFDGDHKRLRSMPADFLSPDEWGHLRAIYNRLLATQEIGSDNLQYDDGLADRLAKDFAKLANRVVPGQLLFAAIMARRKRGEWEKLPKKTDCGFGDIDEVSGM